MTGNQLRNSLARRTCYVSAPTLVDVNNLIVALKSLGINTVYVSDESYRLKDREALVREMDFTIGVAIGDLERNIATFIDLGIAERMGKPIAMIVEPSCFALPQSLRSHFRIATKLDDAESIGIALSRFVTTLYSGKWDLH